MLQRLPVFLLCTLLLLVPALPASAEDGPNLDELARMILEGNDSEHALVAAWLEGADRETLKGLFGTLRALRTVSGNDPKNAPKKAPQTGWKKVEPAPPAVGVTPTPKLKLTALIQCEARIIEVPLSKAAALLGAYRPTPDATHVLLTEKAVRELARAVEQGEATQISAPRLTAYEGQRANVSVLNQISFVQDYDVEVLQGGFFADPIIGVLQEGLVLEFRSVLSKDRKHITVDFEGTWSSLQKPIKEMEVELPGMQTKVTIQLPEVEVGKLKATVTVPDGGWVLLGSGVAYGTGEDQVERVVLFRVKGVDVLRGQEINLVPSNFVPPEEPPPAPGRRPAEGK